MALVRVIKGNIIQAQDINQFIDLVTGGMPDQLINFASGTAVQHLQAPGSQYTSEGTASPPVRMYAATYLFNLAGDSNVTPPGYAHITIPFTNGLVSYVGSLTDSSVGGLACITSMTQTINPTRLQVTFWSNPGALAIVGIVRMNLIALGW